MSLEGMFKSPAAVKIFTTGYWDESRNAWVADKHVRQYKKAHGGNLSQPLLICQLAVSGISRCRRCGKKIEKDSLRLGYPQKDPRGEWGIVCNWVHSVCAHSVVQRSFEAFKGGKTSDKPEAANESLGDSTSGALGRRKRESSDKEASTFVSPSVQSSEWWASFCSGFEKLSSEHQQEIQRLLSEEDPLKSLKNGDILSVNADSIGAEEKNSEKTDAPKTLEAPPELMMPLLPFQKEGLFWLTQQETSDIKGGILADEMGMGKTIQMISLVLSRLRLGIEEKRQRHTDFCAATLIVAPVAAVMQWKQEIERFTKEGCLKVLLYHGQNRDMMAKTIHDYDVVITTYPTVEADFRKIVNKHKIACKYCGRLYLPSKMVFHLRYFCGPDSLRTARQRLTKRKSTNAALKAMRTLKILKPEEALPTPSNLFREIMIKANRENELIDNTSGVSWVFARAKRRNNAISDEKTVSADYMKEETKEKKIKNFEDKASGKKLIKSKLEDVKLKPESSFDDVFDVEEAAVKSKAKKKTPTSASSKTKKECSLDSSLEEAQRLQCIEILSETSSSAHSTSPSSSSIVLVDGVPVRRSSRLAQENSQTFNEETPSNPTHTHSTGRKPQTEKKISAKSASSSKAKIAAMKQTSSATSRASSSRSSMQRNQRMVVSKGKKQERVKDKKKTAKNRQKVGDEAVCVDEDDADGVLSLSGSAYGSSDEDFSESLSDEDEDFSSDADATSDYEIEESSVKISKRGTSVRRKGGAFSEDSVNGSGFSTKSSSKTPKKALSTTQTSPFPPSSRFKTAVNSSENAVIDADTHEALNGACVQSNSHASSPDSSDDEVALDYDLKSSLLHRFRWNRVVLDEAHRVKARITSTAQSIFHLRTAGSRWCLTGTPLQNRVGELYSLVRFLRFDPYAYYFCSKKGCECRSLHYRFDDRGYCLKCTHTRMSHISYFNNKIINPIQKYGFTGEGYDAMQLLKFEVLDKLLLRRTKAERSKDICLPSLTVHIRRDSLSPPERDFYEALYKQTSIQFNNYVESGSLLHNYAHIFDLLSRLRQAVDHPYLIIHGTASCGNIPSNSSGGLDVCGICLADVPEGDKLQSRCKHSFHFLCLKEYIDSAPSAEDAVDREDRGHTEDSQLGCPVCYVPLTVDTSKFQALALQNADDNARAAEISNDELNGFPAFKDTNLSRNSTLSGVEYIPSSASLEVQGGTTCAGEPETLGKSVSEEEGLKQSLVFAKDGLTDAAALQGGVQNQEKSTGNSYKSTRGIMKRINTSNFTSSTKIEALLQELKKLNEVEPESKSIVFSQYCSMLELIEWKIKTSAGIHCARLDGSMSILSRCNILYAFNKDPELKVLLLSLKAGGEGLNLQIANHIFVMDPWWNPASEMQAIQRAHRIGQTKPVVAIRFICKDTIEERILQLQEKKQLVFDGTIGASGSAVAKLSQEDLRFLFQNN